MAKAKRQYERGVKIRLRQTAKKDKRLTSFEVSVPREIAEKVPDGTRFKVELTEEGILYRIIRPTPPLPSWAKETT
jgi:hypothetical protein